MDPGRAAQVSVDTLCEEEGDCTNTRQQGPAVVEAGKKRRSSRS